ncbi:nitrate reductase molybdenum cofactor assembly chaperone [Acidiferrobacter sp.]|jgi:nitrate reductase delta subunit|uniref:nitrate reductase molybdenum cofactor assembly chaperone n=1 Tax=Acidiferrobacter sp. TaxID=1872107 RepID=UPI00262BA1A0|nr:nitrate reductase molybdenum cofactor assembly chaperone [Acidiferrobacter sp.]
MNTALCSPSYRVLAALLEYPDAAFRSRLPELRAALAASGFTSKERIVLEEVCAWMANTDGLDLEALYVRTFDLDAKADLHLTSHLGVDGDRNRGPDLIRLATHFEDAGWALTTRELPDYLPVVLEFAATLGDEAARDLLAGAGEALAAITARLEGIDSPYLPVLRLITRRGAPDIPLARPVETPS